MASPELLHATGTHIPSVVVGGFIVIGLGLLIYTWMQFQSKGYQK